MSKPIHVSDAEFQEKVLKSPTPVIVDFWAPWCGPCRMVAPILDELAKEYEGQIVVAKVNTDDNPQWAMKYGVQGIPTMLFVKDGQLVDRMVGAAPKPFIQQRVDKMLEMVKN
jgi:thioredoxin 1